MRQNPLEKFLKSDHCHAIIILTVIINAINIVYMDNNSRGDITMRIISSINLTCLSIFMIELVMRLCFYKKNFLKNGWFIFDALIVITAVASYIPQLSFLFVIRVLLVLRLCEFMPSLKILVKSLIHSLQGILATLFLVGIIYFIYGNLGKNFFAVACPQFFGTLSLSFRTLLKIMVFDNLGEVLDDLLRYSSWAWIYILSFIFLTAFTFVNLIVGVLIDSMDHITKSDHRKSMSDHNAFMQTEIKGIKGYFAKTVNSKKN